MSAACVRAEAQRVADATVGQQAYELAETFCQQATLRVEALFHALWTNTDSDDVQLTHDLLGGRYTWLEDGIIDQSEGTGPWIAHWEPGASTETNLARRFLTVSGVDARRKSSPLVFDSAGQNCRHGHLRCRDG